VAANGFVQGFKPGCQRQNAGFAASDHLPSDVQSDPLSCFKQTNKAYHLQAQSGHGAADGTSTVLNISH